MRQIEAAGFARELKAGLRSATRVDVAVAYVTKPGLEFANLSSDLRSALARRVQVRLLLDLQTGNTDPSAVWDLVGLSETHRAKFQLRALLPDGSSLLHSKFYLFASRREVTVLTGSANWSEPALSVNIEHGLMASLAPTDPLAAGAQAFFAGVWNSARARPVDREAARLYEEFCGRLRVSSQRGQKRSAAAWRRLADHLQKSKRPRFVWPSADSAYLMGIIAARGTFSDEDKRIEIELLFRSGSYKGGQIRVQRVSFDADQQLGTIVPAIVQRIRPILTGARLKTTSSRISIACRRDLYDQIRGPFFPYSVSGEFRLPKGLATASEDVVQEFVRGFAVASGLVTDHTSLPGNKLTGLPGMMTVWLRPRTPPNFRLFDELKELIERRLDVKVYEHRREDRESHLKIRCESFLQIGFGIDWWDRLVEEGATYNQLLFPATA